MNRSLTIARRHWKPLVCWNLALVILAAVALAKSKPIWTAKTALVLSPNNRNLSANLGKLGNVTDGETFYSQQVNPLTVLASILMSDDTMEKLRSIDPEKERFASLENYKKLYKVTPQEESTIVAVVVTGAKPEIAQTRSDNLVRIYQQRLNQLRQDDAAQRSGFMQKELDQARQNLKQALVALTKFKHSTGLINSEEQTKQMVNTIQNLTATQADIFAKASANQAQAKMLAARLGMTPDQAIRTLRLNERQDYQYTRQKLTETEVLLTKAEAFYQPDAPDVKYLRDERDRLQKQVSQYIQSASANVPGVNPATGNNLAELMQQMIIAESNAKAAQQQAGLLQVRVKQLTKQLQAFPPAQAKLIELQRQYDISEGVYNGLVAKVQETRVNTFSNYPSIQVLDQPKVDPKPGGSKKVPILMGVALASVFGTVALTLLLEGRNPLLSPFDVQHCEIPVLGNIPLLKPSWQDLTGDPGTSVEFQRLASAISLLQLKKQRLLITSAIAGEGKTTIAIGLAHALISLGFKVLLIDGDFRRNTLSQRLGMVYSPEQLGLKQLGPEQLGQPIAIAPGLDFLRFNVLPIQIMEFMAQGTMEAQLTAIQQQQHYDYLLFDSSPVMTTSETALLSHVAQNILWVVRPGLSQRFSLRKAIIHLSRYSFDWSGMVINSTETHLEKVVYKTAKMTFKQS
jgi:polysaccharide biosynthesis transport protein